MAGSIDRRALDVDALRAAAEDDAGRRAGGQLGGGDRVAARSRCRRAPRGPAGRSAARTGRRSRRRGRCRAHRSSSSAERACDGRRQQRRRQWPARLGALAGLAREADASWPSRCWARSDLPSVCRPGHHDLGLLELLERLVAAGGHRGAQRAEQVHAAVVLVGRADEDLLERAPDRRSAPGRRGAASGGTWPCPSGSPGRAPRGRRPAASRS